MRASPSFPTADNEAAGNEKDEYQAADCDADFSSEGEGRGGRGIVGRNCAVHRVGNIYKSALKEAAIN